MIDIEQTQIAVVQALSLIECSVLKKSDRAIMSIFPSAVQKDYGNRIFAFLTTGDQCGALKNEIFLAEMKGAAARLECVLDHGLHDIALRKISGILDLDIIFNKVKARQLEVDGFSKGNKKPFVFTPPPKP